MSTVPNLVHYSEAIPRIDMSSPTRKGLRLACNNLAHGGTFRGTTLGEPCPGCGSPSVPESEYVARGVTSDVPAEFLSDPQVLQMLDRQRTRPRAEKELRTRKTELLAQRIVAVESLETARVREGVGSGSREAVHREADALAAIDLALRDLDDQLDVSAAISKALDDEISKRVETLRAKAAPPAIAKAKKFAQEARPHVDALVALATAAAAEGIRIEGAFGRTQVGGHTSFVVPGTGEASSMLTFFCRTLGPRLTVVDALRLFYEQAARLK